MTRFFILKYSMRNNNTIIKYFLLKDEKNGKALHGSRVVLISQNSSTVKLGNKELFGHRKIVH
jgi:hypothetical protein